LYNWIAANTQTLSSTFYFHITLASRVEDAGRGHLT
jgi:hypothetical protein